MRTNLRRAVVQSVCSAQVLALAASSLAVPAMASGRVAQANPFVPFAAPAAARGFDFKHQHFVVGSAGAKTRRLQHNVCVAPAKPLFVADPSMNAVLIYDETPAGPAIPPSCVLSGAATQLSGPTAVATGLEGNVHYLYVTNELTFQITYYKLPITSSVQAPVATISWNGTPTCANGSASGNAPLQFAYGIVHVHYPTTEPSGQIVETSENQQFGTGTYALYSWWGTTDLPVQCATEMSNNMLVSPSGPSQFVPSNNTTPQIFNANHDTVTRSYYSQTAGWSYSSGDSWTIGPGACTEGTALEQGTLASGADSYIWVTTNKGCNYPQSDALWSCSVANFPGNCPAVPACQNALAQLNFPDFPAYSPAKGRLYVPNQNNGTVTAYVLSGNGGATCKPKSIFVGSTTPVGTAVEF
jgi:hypothetical protein